MTSPPTSLRATRVLIVDDSVVVRRVVTRALEHEPAIEVVGAAADGRSALAKIELLKADVIILDLEMPGINGFETLSEIRRRDPLLPVIIFSHLTPKGAAATLDALALGASDFALKPTADGIGMAEEDVRRKLLPLIRALTGPKAQESSATPVPRRVRPVDLGTTVASIVIVVSTGGPNALAEVLGALPASFPVPILIVQHMPPLFTATLAERLDRRCAMSVTEARAGDRVVAGRVYIAPGGRHMALARTTGPVLVVIHDGPRENSCRPAGDVLFRSAADVYGPAVLGVVMTGMGHDGLLGAAAIRGAGGSVIVQSEATSLVASMPVGVATAGLANAIVSLEGLAAELICRCPGGR